MYQLRICKMLLVRSGGSSYYIPSRSIGCYSVLPDFFVLLLFCLTFINTWGFYLSPSAPDNPPKITKFSLKYVMHYQLYFSLCVCVYSHINTLIPAWNTTHLNTTCKRLNDIWEPARKIFSCSQNFTTNMFPHVPIVWHFCQTTK